MIVKITKSQDKGMLSSNVSYKVKAIIEVSKEESDLIRHYSLNNSVLLERKRKNIFGELTNDIVKITVFDLIQGQIFSCKSLYDIIDYKENIKDAAEKFKTFIEVARNFEGEETFEV